MKFLVSLILAGCSSLVFGQLPLQTVPEVARTGPTVTIDWESSSSLTYFLQYSFDMKDWFYLPIIKAGTGSPIGYGMQSTSDKMFVRLHYTNIPMLDIFDDDSDGDTISNWDEVRAGGTGTNPLQADSNMDGIRDDGLVYAAQNDPDGAGLPAALQLDLLARWDFEQLDFNPPAFSFDDKTGNGWTVSAYGVFSNPEGMVSKAAQIQNGYCAVDADVLQGKTNYSISFWINLTEDSLSNANNGSMQGIYGLQDYIYYVDQFNDAYTDIDSNGLRVKKVGNTEEWNLGSYTYTNHAGGIHGNVATSETNTMTWTRPIGTSDDGKWHHMVVVRSGGQYSVYFDNQIVANGSFAHSNIQFTSVSNLIFGRYFTQVGSPVASTTQMQGKFDRLSIYDKSLTATDVQNIYRQDIDSDGIWDITEHATAYWDDVNHNAIYESGEQAYAVSPFYFHDANEDHDSDKLSSLAEQAIGTNIALFDTDNDGLPDGWEDLYDLDPNNPNDAALDIDGDGLTASEEYAISGTDPNFADTDNDQIPDAQDHPPRWVSISRSLRYDYDDYGPQQPNVPKKVSTKATWPVAVPTLEQLSSPIGYNLLHTRLGQKQPFPGSFPNAGLSKDLIAKGEANTIPSPPCHHASLKHRQVRVYVGTSSTVPRTFKALLYTQRTVNGIASPTQVSVVSAIVPPGVKFSNALDISPSFTGGVIGNQVYTETVTMTLVPLRVSVSCSKFPATGTFGTNPVIFNGGEDLGDPESFPPNGAKGKSLQLFRKYFTDVNGGVLVPIKVDFKLLDLNGLPDPNLRWEAWGNPDSGDFYFANTKSAHYLFERPANGKLEPGLYQFKLIKGFDEEVMRVNVLLPAAGGNIDSWLIAEVPESIDRALEWKIDADADAIANGVTEIDDFRDMAFKAIMHCDFDYQGVATVAGTKYPTDRYSYTDANQTDPAKKANGDWDEPSYASVRGHVVSRAKLTNLFYSVWGRAHGRSELEMRAGAFFNAAIRGQWDNASSQNAISLGSDLYDASVAAGNVGGVLTPARAKAMQTPDVLNDLNLWPIDQVAATNFTLPVMTADYEDLDEGTDECDGGTTRGKAR